MSGLYPGYYAYPPASTSPQRLSHANANAVAGPSPLGHPLPPPSTATLGTLAHLIVPPGHMQSHERQPSGGGPSSDIYNENGKRHLAPAESGEVKKQRADTEDVEDDGSGAEQQDDGSNFASTGKGGAGGKTKATRGSRACMVCRRLKMKCVGAEHGPPCKRCAAGNHECVFEESHRGKRSTKKQEVLAESIRKMERTLDAVVRSIGSGLPEDISRAGSRSPSPVASGRNSVPGLHSQMHSPAHSLPQSQGHHNQHHFARPAGPSPHMASSSTHSHPHSHSGASGAVRSPSSPKLHSLPDNNLNPLGLLAEASLANSRQVVQSPEMARPGATPQGSLQNVGVASDLYFRPGPMTILPLRRLFIERANQPEMLTFTSTEEVIALFKIYFDHMHMHASLLDPSFHTPALVCSRSPFLLTAVCAAAAKFYDVRPELYPKLTELARKLAFEVPALGYKSVEIVQAYIILALWGSGPAERYEMDKTWMLLGMGIRMATDLNLHRRVAHTAPETEDARTRDKEIRNRERTWIMAFVLDRSYSAQLGKPYSIQEDTIIRTVMDWPHHELACPTDFPLAAYAELQRIQSRCLEVLGSTNGSSLMQSDMDYHVVIKTMETQLLDWHNQVTNNMDHTYRYGLMMERFYLNYALLVINSFGLQNAMDRASINTSYFFQRCHTTATACATSLRDELGPIGYMRYSPDSHFVLSSYAVLSLLKLVRPEFHASRDQESTTFTLVGEVADTLERLAVSPMHTPALYSTFLRALLANRMNEAAGAPQPDQNGAMPTSDNGMQPVPMGADGNSMMMANGMGGDGVQHGQVQMDGMSYGYAPSSYSHPDFHFGEMSHAGAADMSTFPPTFQSMSVPNTGSDTLLPHNNFFATGFWDNVLVPGYANPMEGLSGGFVYGMGGGGLITPRLGMSPMASGGNSPAMAHLQAYGPGPGQEKMS